MKQCRLNHFRMPVSFHCRAGQTHTSRTRVVASIGCVLVFLLGLLPRVAESPATGGAQASAARGQSQLPAVHLTLPDDALLAMQHSLRTGDPAKDHDPGGDKPYFDGIVVDGDSEPQRCAVCLRGAMFWHHLPEKPSLRVKIKKADQRGGDRYLELSRPEDVLGLKNWLPLQIAKDLKLITDQTDHVRLFINREYYGVYLRSLRQGEPLALVNGRMPGTFYKGDFNGDLWQSVAAWSVSGEGAAPDLAVFERFLRLLRAPPTALVLDELQAILDPESYARWAALMIVTGSVHTDLVHNHSYFFSPTQGTLEAIPWDCNSFGVHSVPETPVDTILHPVMLSMVSDPRWVHRRNEWIMRLLQSTASRARVAQIVRDRVEVMRRDLDDDQNLGDLRWVDGAWRYDPRAVSLDQARDDLLRWIDARYEFLAKYLADARVFVESGADGSPGSRVHVMGSAAVRVQRRNGTPVSLGCLHAGLSNELFAFRNGPEATAVAVLYAAAAPMTYTLDARAEDLVFTNALTAEPAVVESGPQRQSAIAARTIHPTAFALSPVGDVVLGPGPVDLRADLLVAPRQRLLIRAGTTIRLAAGVGIYSEGVTLAEGTAAAPIHLSPLDDRPWATFALTGAATAGSLLAHVHVAGGSVGNLRELRFKGMVNVYNCPRVTLRDCEFGRNHLGDDTVNLAQTEFQIERCVWQDAAADALDVDLGRGSVRDCRFIDSGNDGLDLMTSTVLVERCVMQGSGDKGLSAGENSRVVVRDSTFTGCKVGTELKDGTSAGYERCRFLGNGAAVHLYQKKAFYPYSGSACLVECEVKDSRDTDLLRQGRARVTLVRTPIGKVTGDGRGIVVEEEVPAHWRELLQLKIER